MNNVYRMQVFLPAGVGVQQTRDGMLILTYTVDLVTPLREKLDQLRAELLERALAAAKEKKEAEEKRQELPKNRLQQIDDEIAALERQKASDLPPAPVGVPLGVGAEGYQPPRLEPRSNG